MRLCFWHHLVEKEDAKPPGPSPDSHKRPHHCLLLLLWGLMRASIGGGLGAICHAQLAIEVVQMTFDCARCYNQPFRNLGI
jgi:hypothetical protein